MRIYSAFFSRGASTLAACCLVVFSLGAVGTCAAYYIAGGSILGADYEHGRTGASGPGRATKAAGAPLVKLADADDPWTQALRSGAFWTKKGSDSSAERRSSRRSKDSRSGRRREARSSPRHETTSAKYFVSIPKAWRTSGRGGSTFRTVCVRLCDGFYWPVSFATTSDNLKRDSKACEASCSSPAALFFYPNPGGEHEEMVNLKGEPYAHLSSAFLYRTTYDTSCKCRAHPWEQEAVERHKQYARNAAGEAATEQARQ